MAGSQMVVREALPGAVGGHVDNPGRRIGLHQRGKERAQRVAAAATVAAHIYYHAVGRLKLLQKIPDVVAAVLRAGLLCALFRNVVAPVHPGAAQQAALASSPVLPADTS